MDEKEAAIVGLFLMIFMAIVSAGIGLYQIVQAMSTLPWWLNMALIAGYVVVGLITGRVVAFKFNKHPATVGFGALLWPLTATIALVIGLGVGSYRLMTRPSKRDRLERQHQRILEQIAALESDLK